MLVCHVTTIPFSATTHPVLQRARAGGAYPFLEIVFYNAGRSGEDVLLSC